jgi:transcriptional regulator with XRE-family HTH domain
MTPREQLADVLRKARLDAGFGSHAALARVLNVTRSTVSKAENAHHRVPGDALLISWAGATGLGSDALVDLAKRCRLGTLPWFQRWRDVEAFARTLALWSPVLVPGLVQVPDYARALIHAEGYSAERVDELVDIRLERQVILERDEPPYVTVVIHESVLDRMIGSPQVMRDEFARLVELSERPNMVVQVVPAAVGACAGLSGGFQIAACDGMPDVVNRSAAFQDVTTESPEVAARAAVTFGLIRGDALSRGESRQLIRDGVERWNRKIPGGSSPVTQTAATADA